jgi:hypothetical protein
MSITATVQGDAIKLPEGVHLPDGTKVRVEPIGNAAAKSFAERYAKFVGVVKDAPTDLAENHDHYLYGQPKRKS